MVTDPAAANERKLLPALGSALFGQGIASNLGKVYVSLAHSDADIDETIRAYQVALAQVRRGVMA